jgi:predicted enzyme related to lactoylglutathione lyase
MILSGHNDNDNINNNNTNLFKSLDFLYVPAPDIQASVNYYTKVLDGELLWKIHDFGVWVACIGISNTGPYILLADHIKSHDPILIYRVENIDNVADRLHSRGWTHEKALEIPPGPCYVFRDPADNAIAIYENRRPEVMDKFRGRID